MQVLAGDSLGNFRILAPLGKGGMGEVYRARDLRLDREVAIKILSASLANDAGALARFEREAKAVAALSHPNIIAIHGFEKADDRFFVVMELLEGESLRERMSRSRMPTRSASDIADKIVAGLCAAHARGIIHRDLKPENIFLTRDGQIKILDFGLAIFRDCDEAADPSATVGLLTEAGAVLGTPSYMSPEQASCKIADARSDIFSVGSILYEMFTGVRAFARPTTAETLTAIIREDVEFPASTKNVPDRVQSIVLRCLEKDSARRFQTASDLAFALSQSSNAEPWRTSSSFRWKTLAIVAALAFAALALWAIPRWMQNPKRPQAIEFQRLTDFAGLEEAAATAPDGKAVAFVADAKGTRQIWVRLLAGGAPLQITHDAGDHLFPRWSQDSSFIYYYVPPEEQENSGTLWQVSALGGSPRRLANSVSEADVSHDGKKLTFFRMGGSGVDLVSSDTDGSNQHLISSFPSATHCRNPRWSPDDSSIAYNMGNLTWADDLYIVPEHGGEPRQITHQKQFISGLSWTAAGDGIVYATASGNNLLYLSTTELWFASRSGSNPLQLTYGDVSYQWPDVDSQGNVVASANTIHFDIWKFPIDGPPDKNVLRGGRITHQTAHVQTPSVSPDERQMAYISDSGGHGNVWIKDLRSGDTRQITSIKGAIKVGVPLWSPRGDKIAFVEWPLGGDVEYWLVDPDGSNLHRLITSGIGANWSGDSRWLYYSSASDAKSILYKIPSGGGDPVPVRKDEPGSLPSPAADGSSVSFVVPLKNLNGTSDFDIRIARPEDGLAKSLGKIAANRVPPWQALHPTMSPDGKYLALLLNDEFGTNIWLMSTADGKMRKVTDFGDRRTFIARRVCFSPDGKFIYAAVGDADSDIVKLDGLLR